MFFYSRAFLPLIFIITCQFSFGLSLNKSCKKFMLGNKAVCLEIPKNTQEKKTGLMHREKLLDNNGMLFSWEKSSKYCMWMKNTLIPLDVAFIDKSFKIKKISQMFPKSLKSYCANVPVKYIVEMNKGWFKKNNVKVGDKLKFV